MWALYVSLAFLVATLFTLYPSHFDLKKNLMVHLTEKEIKHYDRKIFHYIILKVTYLDGYFVSILL